MPELNEVVEVPKNKRDQVKECIKRGDLTKAEIATALGMSLGSVSSQMTYLRWMDNYIVTDPETKILSFTTKEAFEALEAEKKANKSTKTTATRTPEERAQAVAKTIGTQEKQLAKWQAKSEQIAAFIAEHPEDADAALAAKEATASIALLEVKLARNTALLESLPEIEDVSDEDDDADADNDVPEPDDTDLL